jgi:hypothetical protein
LVRFLGRCDHLGVDPSAGPAWSDAVEEASWIGERLAPFDTYRVTSFEPRGFAAYARVLHPAADPLRGERLVRWADVAAWSGMPLQADAQFHSVALPPVRPDGDPPGWGMPPETGSLYPPDAEILAGIAREWTTTPERCWFCVWDGYGWDGTQLARPGEPSVPLPATIPQAVLRGPRVHLPERDYLLYAGPVETVDAVAPVAGSYQTANLWWPSDRAWCVASEIDLPWTYVGGPAGLIERLLADGRLEVLPAGPDDPLTRTEDWVTTWAAEATTRLLSTGEAVITTSRGTVEARLERLRGRGRATLRTWTRGDSGVTRRTWGTLSHRDKGGQRDEICRRLCWALIGLVEG